MFYRHYKNGKIYQIVHAGVENESNAVKMVVYRDVETGKNYVRPQNEFLGKIENKTRFEKVDISDAIPDLSKRSLAGVPSWEKEDIDFIDTSIEFNAAGFKIYWIVRGYGKGFTIVAIKKDGIHIRHSQQMKEDFLTQLMIEVLPLLQKDIIKYYD